MTGCQNQFPSNLFSKGYRIATSGNIITISDSFHQVQGKFFNLSMCRECKETLLWPLALIWASLSLTETDLTGGNNRGKWRKEIMLIILMHSNLSQVWSLYFVIPYETVTKQHSPSPQKSVSDLTPANDRMRNSESCTPNGEGDGMWQVQCVRSKFAGKVERFFICMDVWISSWFKVTVSFSLIGQSHLFSISHTFHYLNSYFPCFSVALKPIILQPLITTMGFSRYVYPPAAALNILTHLCNCNCIIEVIPLTTHPGNFKGKS